MLLCGNPKSYLNTIRLIQNTIFRQLSSLKLCYNSYGEPLNVLYEEEQKISSPINNQVLLKFLASPINPSDINTIQGVYPSKPSSLPAVPGFEGVAEVIECGADSSLKCGDLVIPAGATPGTWQTHAIVEDSDVIKVDSRLTHTQAAFLKINPPTALIMLSDFVNLKPGDTIIQNGATSAVGIYIMQICKILGLHSVNLFRPRLTDKATESTRKLLLDYGATLAITEDELRNNFKFEFKNLGTVKLGLNCLGGKPALSLMRCLSHSGVLVTYGGMTRQPIPLPIGPLIFNDVHLCGFWLTKWTKKEENSKIFHNTLTQLTDWMIDGKMRLSPFDELKFKDWKTAISQSLFSNSAPSGVTKKTIMIFE